MSYSFQIISFGSTFFPELDNVKIYIMWFFVKAEGLWHYSYTFLKIATFLSQPSEIELRYSGYDRKIRRERNRNLSLIMIIMMIMILEVEWRFLCFIHINSKQDFLWTLVNYSSNILCCIPLKFTSVYSIGKFFKCFPSHVKINCQTSVQLKFLIQSEFEKKVLNL